MATRSQRFVSTLLSAYGSIVANLIFTMASVPLALHYLSKEQFGLWALALQVNGYLSLLEFGMSGAMVRFVADHKDDVNGGEYGCLLITGGWVFAIQGAFIVVAGLGLAAFAPYLFAVPSHLSGDFTKIVAILSTITGVSLMLRIVAAPLWAFQRMDIVNGLSSAGLLFRLLLIWVGLHLGFGIDSLAWSLAPPTVITLTIYWYICLRNGYYPRRGCWGRPRWDIFTSIFAYGRDTMILSLGNQLVNASQITIISRILGLDAAATFSIATKLFGMTQQVFHKVVESAAPGLTEMHVRGEHSQFVTRYREIISITLVMSTVGSIALVIGNSAFISIWTNGSVQWSLTNDVLLGLLVVITSLSRCFMSVFGLVKKLEAVRLLYVAEGIIFVPTAVLAAKWYGLTGVLAASLVAHLLATLFYSAKAASGMLGSWRPLIPTIALSLSLISCATLIAWAGVALHGSPVVRLSLVALGGLIGIAPLWFVSVPESIRSRLLATVTSRLRRKCRA